MRYGPLLALLACLTGQLAAAEPTEETTDLLYMGAEGWHAATPVRKLALSAAFMRIFCTDRQMQPQTLVLCLEADQAADLPLFGRALTCLARRDHS